MKLPKLNILSDKEKVLREESEEVVFPLANEDRKRIIDMMDYLEMSQIEESREKYDLRAGMGLAYVQLGILKRIFVIVHEQEDGTFNRYVVINPKVKSTSEELVYVGEGEGCLSVNYEVEGIVPRCARMWIEAFDIDGNKYDIRVREELAIAFQHEIDHLDGILFTDKIDKKNPFKNMEKMREI